MCELHQHAFVLLYKPGFYLEKYLGGGGGVLLVTLSLIGTLPYYKKSTMCRGSGGISLR